MTNEEKIICKMYLDDLGKPHGCNEYELLMQLLEQQPSEEAVSRDVIRLKLAEIPQYTDGKKLASIRHLEDFLEKELEEPIEVTQDMCIGFTMALECIGKFIKDLPSVTPTRKKGKWIVAQRPSGLIGCKCSKCGIFYPLPDGLNFCPNCGDEKELEE